MLKRKRLDQKGKVNFTKYFQTFKAGDSVAIARDLGFKFGFSHRMQGRTGKVLSKRGKAYYIEVNDLNKPKRYSIKPIHLVKIK